MGREKERRERRPDQRKTMSTFPVPAKAPEEERRKETERKAKVSEEQT